MNSTHGNIQRPYFQYLNELGERSYQAMLPSAAVVVAITLIVLTSVKLSRTNSKLGPLPPGPRGWPLIGNALSMSRGYPWKTCRQWAEDHGDIVHVNIFGQPTVILHSVQDAIELLDKRSSIYSDRLQDTMIPLLGLEWDIAVMPYGALWRKYRLVLHKLLNVNAITLYTHIQQRKAQALLLDLIREPENFLTNTYSSNGSALIEMMYGNYSESVIQRYLHLASSATTAFFEAFLPGAMAVQYLPFLRYLPSWFPGGAFQHKIAKWRKDIEDFIDEPYRDAKAAMQEGSAVPCILTSMLTEAADLPEDERSAAEITAKHNSATIYAGGSDTTDSTMTTFYLAMVLNPECQEAAQAELMKVVGPHRLPQFSDRESLPYVNAILKECMRWIPAVPLGFPHANTEDDIYNGYAIPKGTMIICNQWSMLHNPDDYPEPEQFRPERFLKDGKLNSSVRDPYSIAFGFGRRICPGRHLADAALFIYIASILHVLQISPALNADGAPILPAVDVTATAILSQQKPFKCHIEARSLDALALIQSES